LASAAWLVVRPAFTRLAIARRRDIWRRLRGARHSLDCSVPRHLQGTRLAPWPAAPTPAPSWSNLGWRHSREIWARGSVPGYRGLLGLALTGFSSLCRICRARRSAAPTPAPRQSRGFALVRRLVQWITRDRGVLSWCRRLARVRRFALLTFGGLGVRRLCVDPIGGWIVGRMWHRGVSSRGYAACGGSEQEARDRRPFRERDRAVQGLGGARQNGREGRPLRAIQGRPGHSRNASA